MKGVQLIADKGGKSKICKDYKTRGVPHYFLVDPEGKLMCGEVEAPGPSYESIKEILTEIAGETDLTTTR